MPQGIAALTIGENVKCCSRCATFKHVDEFRRQANGLLGRKSLCVPCERKRDRELHVADPDKRRARVTRNRYGIDHEQYLELVAAQDGKCAICRTEQKPPRPGQRYWLHIDHDHETGDIRGLLCTNCNNGIGHLRHDPVVLRQAIEYLEGGDDLSQ